MESPLRIKDQFTGAEQFWDSYASPKLMYRYKN